MSSAQNTGKQAAAQAALEFVPDGAIIGVGTGSTVDLFIDALAARRDRFAGAVSSSQASTRRLRAAGIEVVELNAAGDLEVYVDGADEATRHGCLVKGGGGALTREKIIAAASRRFVCIIDGSKMVDVLGRCPLPVEVIPMARSYVAREIAKRGGQPVWREAFLTDDGHQILDVHGLAIRDPVAMERELDQVAGVVTVGLFALRPADVVLVGRPGGVEKIDLRR